MKRKRAFLSVSEIFNGIFLKQEECEDMLDSNERGCERI
jgi:hypothetical protein